MSSTDPKTSSVSPAETPLPEKSEKPLSHRAAKGASKMAFSQLIRIVLQLAGIIVLARLLLPSDYGLIAMATALIGIAEVLRDFGLAPAAIQSRTLSAAERSNLVWANSALGLILGALVACAAWPISALYGDDRLVPIILALAPIFFLNGISTQFRADLSRSMQFGRMAIIEISTQAIALLTGITAALVGFGYWAIVCQQLVQAISTLLLVVASSPWRIKVYDKRVSLKRFFKYGISLLGTQLLVYATSNLDSVLIGARFGSVQLGLYNRAFQMLVLPLNQISSPATRVALPVLARIVGDKSQFLRFVLRGQLCLSWLVLPVFGFAAANSDLVIRLLLGDQWRSAAGIFSFLAVGGMFQTLSYTTYWVFLSKGLTGSNFRFAVLTRSLMLGALCLGAMFSVSAVAIAYSSSLIAIWLLGLLWIHRASGFNSSKAFQQGLTTLLLVGLSSAASYLAAGYFQNLEVIWRLVLSVAIFMIAYALVCLAVPFWRSQALDVFAIVRVALRRKVSGPDSAI
jgi:PST family polysaccharide transporter